jgi:Mn-dependent DtxR family transcriptional regulator
MKNERMQCKDIADSRFLQIVDDLAYRRISQRHEHIKSLYDPPDPVMSWDVSDHLGVDQKLMLAKAERLIERGLMDGCPCGCRGDFELTTAGEELVRSSRQQGKDT